MLRGLVVDNFRAFEHFELGGLGRINLLVGTNNCGKTSALEAIYLLAAREARALRAISIPRGERVGADLDPSHLFYGRSLHVGAQLTIKGEGVGALTAKVVRGVLESTQATLNFMEEGIQDNVASNFAVELMWSNKTTLTRTLPISQRGAVSATSPAMMPIRGGVEDAERTNVELLNTQSLNGEEAVRLLEEVILTPEESTLIEALKTIEPTIERIASASSSISVRQGRGGVFVKCSGIDRRIPIGSMGDGIWRLLGIALSLVATRDGILLIDEIDTGLHYSVMETMWTLVCKTAERLNVQVFATTHSRDCYEALAAISRADAKQEDNKVSIQRIERGKSRAVAFSEAEIVIAARRGIEVR